MLTTIVSTVVTPSANASQVLFLIAVILFLIGGVAALLAKPFWSGLILFGLAATAAGLLWLP